MFKAARRKSEKNKAKAVFKFQFKATKVPQLGWEELVVSLLPMDTGKPTARSEKALVVQGSCHWLTPTYEAVWLTQDSKTGKINEKTYLLVLSATGSGKSEFLGEVVINLADYAESFKPSSVSLPLTASNAETILHITLQRVHGEGEGRGTDENADTTAEKDQRRTLRSQLRNYESEDEKTMASAANEKKQKEEPFINVPAPPKPFSRTMAVQVESNGNLGMLDNFEAISTSGSNSSSERYTPKENNNMNDILYQDYSNLSSPPCSNCTPLGPIKGASHDYSILSAPNRGINGSICTSREALLREDSLEPDSELEKPKNDIIALTRQLEVSELELQTLRKQVVKESRKGQEVSRELQRMKEERDELGRECEELRAAKKGAETEAHFSAMLHYGGKDLWSMLDETKQELDHEKKTNANISLQLKKTRESNSELILAVRDLEELLQQNNGGICSCGFQRTYIKSEEEYTNKIKLSYHSECKHDFVETSTQEEDGQFTHTVDVLVKDASGIEVMGLPDQNIAQLTTELDLYKKECEELEMQMEQLALDYEILKQENHCISTKLEQIQLREQLRMQYENSSHCSSISDIETQIESMEKEFVNKEEEFQADLEAIIRAKVELEKRAIQAEEALRKMKLCNCNTVEQLQSEFKSFTLQMSSAIQMDEKLMMQTLKEYNELQLQKCNLEVMLQKKNEEVEFVRHQHHLKCQQLIILIDFKTKEVDRLHMELKEKCMEFEDQRLSAEALQRASLEQIAHLKSEIENLSTKNDQLIEQIKHEKILIEELEQMNVSTKSCKKLADPKTQRSILEQEDSLFKEKATKSLQKLDELEQIIDNDAITRNLSAELVAQSGNYNLLKYSIFDNEWEKENLRQQISLLWDDIQKEADFFSIIESNLKDHNVKLTNSGPKQSSTTNMDFKNTQEQEQFGFKRAAAMHEKATISEEHRSNGNSSQDSFLEDKSMVKDLNSIVKELIICDIDYDGEVPDEKSVICTNEQKPAEVLREMAELKEQNHTMEIELKQMQERYSEMSLRFAEVEGERQKLVIKIRSLKNP